MASGGTKKEEIVVGLVVGILVVGIVIYMSSQGGSGSGFAVLGPSDAVQTAALNAQAAADASQNSLSSTQSSNATAAFEDYINQSDALSSALATTQAGVQTAKVNAQSSVSINATNANAQVAINGATDTAQTAIANLQTQSANTIASITGSTAVQVAQSTSGAAVGVAQATGAAAVSAAQANAQAASNANPGNSVGGIIGGITSALGGLFSFLNPSPSAITAAAGQANPITSASDTGATTNAPNG